MQVRYSFLETDLTMIVNIRFFFQSHCFCRCLLVPTTCVNVNKEALFWLNCPLAFRYAGISKLTCSCILYGQGRLKVVFLTKGGTLLQVLLYIILPFKINFNLGFSFSFIIIAPKRNMPKNCWTVDQVTGGLSELDGMKIAQERFSEEMMTNVYERWTVLWRKKASCFRRFYKGRQPIENCSKLLKQLQTGSQGKWFLVAVNVGLLIAVLIV